MTISEINSVVREVRIEARPETVWGFLTDPEKMVQWQGIEAKIDLKPGGQYWVNMNGSYKASGAYVEVMPYERLVWTWGWEGEGNPVPPGASTVEVTLTPEGDGTLLRLVHRGLPTPDTREAHGMGWDHYLARLAVRAAGGDPGPDTPMMDENGEMQPQQS